MAVEWIGRRKGVLMSSCKYEIPAHVQKNLPKVSKKPTSVYPAGDGAYVMLFEGVAESFFDEYVVGLEKGGYARYTATSFNGANVENTNRFATYITDAYSVDLGYHAKGYLDSVSDDPAKESYGNKFDGGILFVTVSPREGLTLPAQEAPAYTPVDLEKYPTILTQVGLGDYHPNEASNCYIIRLADGTFIVQDAGYGGSMLPRTTADAIYDVLKKQAMDPDNIVITAWMTTHPHRDHMDGLEKFADKYASDPGITIKQFVHNFAEDSIATPFERSCQVAVRASMEKFGDVEVVKPHAGNVLYYANVKFRVLYSHENHLQLNGGEKYDGNASSLVMQMETEDGVKVLFGADSPQRDNGYGGKPFTYGAIHKRYGSFLESDIMTNMHHGLGGGSGWDTNATIKPKIVLWPVTWGKIAAGNLGNSSHAPYFSYRQAKERVGEFAEGVLHETPNDNGVYGWFVADDNIHVINLKQGDVTVTVYDTHEEYYNS